MLWKHVVDLLQNFLCMNLFCRKMNKNKKNYKIKFILGSVLLIIYLMLMIFFLLLREYLYKEYGIEFRPKLIDKIVKIGMMIFIMVVLFFLISANKYFSILENPKIEFDFYMNAGVIFVTLLLIAITLLYKSVFYKEREDIIDDYYLAVYQIRPWDAVGDGMAKGEYEPLNDYVRKRITVDYGLEKLLEHRYGLKFSIKKENGKTIIVPEEYPEYEFYLYDPFFYTLDIPESLMD